MKGMKGGTRSEAITDEGDMAEGKKRLEKRKKKKKKMLQTWRGETRRGIEMC